MEFGHSAAAHPHTVRTRFTAIGALIAIALTTVFTLGSAHADFPPNTTASSRFVTDASTDFNAPTQLAPATSYANGAPTRLRVTNVSGEDQQLFAAPISDADGHTALIVASTCFTGLSILPANATCTFDIAAQSNVISTAAAELDVTLISAPVADPTAFLSDTLYFSAAIADSAFSITAPATDYAPFVFGDPAANTRNFTVTNDSGNDQRWTPPSVRGDVTLGTSTCPAGGDLFAAGATCVIQVVPTPSAPPAGGTTISGGLQLTPPLASDPTSFGLLEVAVNWPVPIDQLYAASRQTPFQVADTGGIDVDVPIDASGPNSILLTDLYFTGPDAASTTFNEGTAVSPHGPWCSPGDRIDPATGCSVRVHITSSKSGSDPFGITVALHAAWLDGNGSTVSDDLTVINRVRPTNDDWQHATDLGSATGTFHTNPFGASTQAGVDPAGYSQSVWFKWIAPAGWSQPLTLTTNDATASVLWTPDYSGTGPLSNNGYYNYFDPTFTFRLFPNPGTTYYFGVVSNGFSTNDLTISIPAIADPPGNDNLDGAGWYNPIGPSVGTGNGNNYDTFSATTQSPDEATVNPTNTPSVWYSLSYVGNDTVSAPLEVHLSQEASIPSGSGPAAPASVVLFSRPTGSPGFTGLVNETPITTTTTFPQPWFGAYPDAVDIGSYLLVPGREYFVGVFGTDAYGYWWMSWPGTTPPPPPAPTIDPYTQPGPFTALDSRGTPVTFAVPTSPDGGVQCNSSPGSNFPVGQTTVHCSISNAGGAATQDVNVDVVAGQPLAPSAVVGTPSTSQTGTADVVFRLNGDGGNPGTTYTVTADSGQSSAVVTPGVADGPGALLHAAVTGLPIGVPITFTVTATTAAGDPVPNAVVTSAASAPTTIAAPAGAVAPSTGTGANPTVSTPPSNVPGVTGTTSVAASGSGSVTVSQYPTGTNIPAAPGIAPFSQGGLNPFDVYVAPGSLFSTVTINSCPATGPATLWWYKTGVGWQPVDSQWVTFVPGTPGCLQFVATTSTIPAISDLGGTVFAVQAAPASATITAGATNVKVGSTTTLDVHVVDSGANAVPGAAVVLSGPASPLTGTTDASGNVQFTVGSSAAGDVVYSVTANGVPLSATATVHYGNPPSFGAIAAPNGTEGASYSYALPVTGADSTSATAASLPPGISLVNGVLTGTPTTAGDYAVSVTATNVWGSTGATVNVHVVAPAASATLTPAASSVPVGGSTTIGVAVRDTHGVVVPSAALVLSGGGSTQNATTDASGAASFTVTSASAGTVTYSLTANGIAVGSTTVTYGVAPSFGTIAAPAGTVGAAYAYTVPVTGATSVTANAATLPPGVTFNGTSFGGAPTTAGTYPVTLTATNAFGSSQATVTITVNPATTSSGADLKLTLTASSFTAGETGQFRLTVTNKGTATATAPIVITDTLPVGLTYAKVSGTGWKCTAVGQAVTCTNTSSLGVGKSTTLTIDVRIARTLANATVTDQATVAFNGTESPATTADNTASVSVKVRRG